MKKPKREGEREREKEKDDVKVLNQEIMWHDAFWLKLPVYIGAEGLEEDCMEEKSQLQTIGRLINLDRKKEKVCLLFFSS